MEQFFLQSFKYEQDEYTLAYSKKLVDKDQYPNTEEDTILVGIVCECKNVEVYASNIEDLIQRAKDLIKWHNND